MDVVIGVFVEVVVFQEEVSTRDYADVAIEVTADVHAAGAIVSGLQFLGYFQDHPIAAPDVAVDTDDPEWLKMTSDEGIPISDYEMMLAQPAVVDVLVVVPGVPVVGVVARRNFSSA